MVYLKVVLHFLILGVISTLYAGSIDDEESKSREGTSASALVGSTGKYKVVQLKGENDSDALYSNKGAVSYYSLDGFPLHEDISYIELYKDKDGKIYIAAINKENKLDNNLVVLYEFPIIKKTDIRFFNNEAVDRGYEKVFDYSPVKLNGQRLGFQRIGGKLPEGCVPSTFQNYLTIEPYANSEFETEMMFFVNMIKPLVNLNPDSCWYFKEGRIEQSVVSVRGEIYKGEKTLYIIDQHSRIILPINFDLSIEGYCGKTEIYQLDMKRYAREFRSIMSTEDSKNYSNKETLIKNLLLKIKQQECS